MPCGVLGSVESLVNTVNLFASNDSNTMTALNVDFLTRRGVWPNPLQTFGLNQVMHTLRGTCCN